METIVTREKANIVRPDMINLLIEAKKGQLKHERQSDEDAGFATVQESDVGTSEKRKMELSEDDLAAQAMIFFFAGFETTSTFMTFMAMEMSINIDVQRKLQEEIDGVLKGYNGDISYETIMNMKYLDQVVSGTYAELSCLCMCKTTDKHFVVVNCELNFVVFCFTF